MQLYIKEKVFSWTDKFAVKDAYGQDRYFVEGELFSWGKRLHICDVHGRERALVRQKLWSFFPTYYVEIGGQQVAEIVKEFSLFLPKYTVRGLDWEVAGRFLEHDYDITQSGRTIISIHKEWMTWGDCYELDISEDADELMALAVVLAIDCVTEKSSGVSISISSN